ncbi:VTC domain-containing protein [Candidatus Pseudoscillospira sp. SGI.172]|uniref:VTC domain-containing protein n=1 Tax=Candidatus Pseudoscillospira sp. SGI.172 TaxID=3420582 RepID=UPI003D069C9A
MWFSAFSRSVALLRQSLRNAVLQTLPNTHPGFNTRITLDNNLRCCNLCFDLFRPQLNCKKTFPSDQTILEVKFDRFLFRRIQEVLVQCNLTWKPPSKFGSSRAVLKKFYS